MLFSQPLCITFLGGSCYGPFSDNNTETGLRIDLKAKTNGEYWTDALRPLPLQLRQNGLDSVLNHQPHDCLLKRLFRHWSKKTSKLRVTGPLCGEFTGDRWIPRTKGQLRGKCFHLMTSSWHISNIQRIGIAQWQILPKTAWGNVILPATICSKTNTHRTGQGCI